MGPHCPRAAQLSKLAGRRRFTPTDAALAETDRAINDLRFRGIEIFTDHNGRPVDAPEILPLYEKMARYNLPILLHPRRTRAAKKKIYADNARRLFRLPV